MSDSADTAGFESVPADPAQPVTADAAQPVSASAGAPWASDSASQASGGAAEHPELLVGAAFAGGLLLATILKRLAG